MQTNVGVTDRIIRLLIATSLIAAALILPVGTAAIVLYIFAGIAALTAVFGFCPLYRLFGWSTNPAKR
jgi:hypothetical protein